MPKLLLKFNSAVIKDIPLDKDRLTVGRSPDNDIVIDNPAISSRHCKISLEGGTYYVEDLDSTNGTYVNEKRVKKAGLHNNDVVGLANHGLVLIEDALAPQAAASPDKGGRVGCLRVLEGAAGGPEYELKGTSAYIGKSDRVQIPIKGKGLFGSAPEVAASIHRKADGYYLIAVTEGYPVVNGVDIVGSVKLGEGDIIVCGATKMQFILKEASEP